jgi:hypothetical protein
MIGPSMKDTAGDLIRAEFERQLNAIATGLQEGKVPAAEQVSSFENLSKLMTLIPRQDDRVRKIVEIGLWFLVALVLLLSIFIRVPSTSVELDVRASNVNVGLAEKRLDSMLPGEHGEVLALKQANISGIQDVEPPWVNSDGGILELRAGTPLSRSTSSDLALRLQSLTVPASGSFKLSAGVSYRPNLRGLVLSAIGNQPTIANFGEVIFVSSSAKEQTPRPAIRPVLVTGNELRIELYPVDAQTPLTALRNIPVSTIAFEAGEDSGILGGNLFVKSYSQSKVTVEPGDHLQIRSDQPILVRELTFSKGQLEAKVSVRHAIAIFLGDEHPHNLMPSLFDWVRSRWPTQLYATLAALVALWIGLRGWWKSSA